MSGAIIVSHVSKRFRQQANMRPSTLKALLLSGYRGGSPEYFTALRDVSFRVAPGRSVGVIGRNGAGKSTLLRLLSGVGRPDQGEIRINGRMGALLEIGAGLTGDLTGRENIFIMGVVAGMLRAEIKARFDTIVAFSGLEDFIDRPVRTYSTGMRMRLAFAVAVHIEPEVLLVDEVLAVGDLAFQRKCFARIEEIKARGCTIFLVSHDLDQIRALCDDALFLRDGEVAAFGPIETVLPLFEASMEPESPPDEPVEESDTHPVPEPPPTTDEAALVPAKLEYGANRYGNGEAEVLAVMVRGGDGTPAHRITSDEPFQVDIRFRAHVPIDDVIVLFAIYAPDMTLCLETTNRSCGLALSASQDANTATIFFDRLDLAEGDYHVTVGVFSSDWEKTLDYHAEAYSLAVEGRWNKGVVAPPVAWSSMPDDQEAVP